MSQTGRWAEPRLRTGFHVTAEVQNKTGSFLAFTQLHTYLTDDSTGATTSLTISTLTFTTASLSDMELHTRTRNIWRQNDLRGRIGNFHCQLWPHQPSINADLAPGGIVLPL